MPEAIEAVGKMIAGYPNGKPQDSYIGTIAALLCDYPRMIATQCADPVRGVARTTKFLPTVADVVAWCEAPLERMERISKFEQRSDKQLRERRQQEDFQREEPAEHRAAVVDRIRAEMAAAGVPLPADRKRLHGETPDTVKARYGLSEADWNAIPDADPGAWRRLQETHRR